MNQKLLIIILLSTFIVTQGNAVPKPEKKPRKFIIDTDAGGDDAIGILLALNYEAVNKDKIEIIAITCVHGNTAEKNVEKNVLKTLTVASRSDIPVYGGAERALINDYKGFPFFGKDGFGDFEFTEEITAKVDRSKIAAVALIDLVKAHPGEVSILALGPLTNIALATRLDSTFLENIDDLIIMGASVAGIGNEKPNVEFNFSIDPESNFIVLNSTKKPCTLMSWETALNANIGKIWRRDVFGKLNSTFVKFLDKVDGLNLHKPGTWSGVDAMTVALAIWPQMIKKSQLVNITPVFDGAAKGSVLVDYFNKTGKSPNTKLVQSIDLEFHKQQLLLYFSDQKAFLRKSV